MAVLSDADRALVNGSYIRDETSQHGTVTKADLHAAVNALDDWFDTNAGLSNLAIA